MDSPLELIFKNFVDTNDEIRKLVTERSKKLEQFFNHITHCHVTIEQLPNIQHTGHNYRILIVLTISGHHDVVAEHKPAKGEKNTAPLAKLVRETFQAAERRVKEVKAKMKGNVKAHTRGPDKADIAISLNEEPEEVM